MGYELKTCRMFIPDANHLATEPHENCGTKCYFLARRACVFAKYLNVGLELRNWITQQIKSRKLFEVKGEKISKVDYFDFLTGNVKIRTW
jgi:hypothetical protein